MKNYFSAFRRAKIKHFFEIGIWRVKVDQLSTWRRIALFLTRRLYLSIRFFIARGHIDYATQLAFSTLLALVPVFAFVFAIGRGFGFNVFIEQWCREVLSSQPQVANSIIHLANSYIAYTNTGIFIGVGLVLMLYSILSLIYNIEHVFDSIWQVKKKRSWSEILLDYTGLLFMVPVIIIVVSGLSVVLYANVDKLQHIVLLGTVVWLFVQKIVPWLLMTFIFTIIFVYMPNTKVQVLKALGPGMLASASMLILQYFYVHYQALLTSYNIIYGSLAALPLFLIWLQVSWYICLFCTELCYINQNVSMYEFLLETRNISHNNRMFMSLMIMSQICRRQKKNKEALTARQLKELTGFPLRIVTDILKNLCETGLAIESYNADQTRVTYFPYGDSGHLTVGQMVDKLESFPHDTYHNLQFNFEKDKNSDTLHRIFDIRRNYLRQLKDIPVNEVIL
ncbi:YihY/virulence factor BrkB family protein [Prevotella cerevisiae]|jgi:membrane protein|uniref:YihY/virulence factor BrkB family protein n=1 Tax=Segatella cerevisiae TaxID=2053716 RepID=A0ABT1BVN0_9BACT|nr:YihY/virulence factor BrkB family protein [Segatella cerevisiae]MCH3994428.1 YihY/virulence factor BrkB family protein [Prevotella sp.]MCO6024865.1 YihY/virulence factor BrkB family protein [Segatella cerevisiae]